MIVTEREREEKRRKRQKKTPEKNPQNRVRMCKMTRPNPSPPGP
jgi:hypothetical protein